MFLVYEVFVHLGGKLVFFFLYLGLMGLDLVICFASVFFVCEKQ